MADLKTEQQSAQSALAALILRDLQQAWPNLNAENMKGTLPQFTTLIYSLVNRYAPMSGSLAGRFYQAARRSAGLPSGSVRIADTPGPQQVSSVVQWATKDLWADPTALQPAQTKVDGAVAKLVLDVGRLTVVDTARQDRKALAWARIPEDGACAFCALLSTRGATYFDAGTAGRDANARFVGKGQFKYHDHCRCIAEPIFTAYEPSAQIRQWQADYKHATKGVTGGGTNLLNAWRRHYEATYLAPVAQPVTQ